MSGYCTAVESQQVLNELKALSDTLHQMFDTLIVPPSESGDGSACRGLVSSVYISGIRGDLELLAHVICFMRCSA